MRVAFDGTTLEVHQTGIGYYSEHLLQHLAQLRPSAGIELFLLSHRPIACHTPLSPRVRQVEELRFRWRSLWIQALAPTVLKRIGADVAHFTNSMSPLYSSVPTVLTVHDMSLKLFPETHPWRRQLTRPLIRLCARRAAAVITVSESSRRDIIQLLGVPARKVHVIREAAAPCFRPCQEPDRLRQMRERYGLGSDLIVYVGTIEPRKNLPRLIRAFKGLRNSGFSSYQLVCIGALGWGYREVQKTIAACGLSNAVRLLGYVPFDDLPLLYNLATVFVFPSLHEGFGLPVLEAMACKIPVLTSANSALLEFGQESAEFVDPESDQSVLEALVRLLRDPERRRELAQRGFQLSREYSWTSAAQATLEIYQASADR